MPTGILCEQVETVGIVVPHSSRSIIEGRFWSNTGTKYCAYPPSLLEASKSIGLHIPKMSNHAREPPLFDSTLISPAVVAALPPNYVIRPLARSDFSHGFLDVLRVLTSVGDITESKWNDQYDWMQRRNDEYFIMVIWDGEKVVGTGTVLIERKLWGFSLASLFSLRTALTSP